MSHERDAIARAFSRPFIEPPKRATAKRVGLTLAGIALLAAGGLIFNERQPLETTNGVECTYTSTIEDSDKHGAPSKGMSGTVRIEFVSGNLARYQIGTGHEFDFTEPMTATGGVYSMVVEHIKTTIDRETGEFRREKYLTDSDGWIRDTMIGTCHAIHIDANM
jgi:hypothetical protein